MNTILKYGVILSCGSVLGLTASWASEEQKTPQPGEVESAMSQPTFVSIGEVQVQKGILPEETLRALQEQQEKQKEQIEKLLSDYQIMKAREEQATKKMKEEILPKAQWLSEHKYLEEGAEKKLTWSEILLFHHFAAENNSLLEQIKAARLETENARKEIGALKAAYSKNFSLLRQEPYALSNLNDRCDTLARENEDLIHNYDRLKRDYDRLIAQGVIADTLTSASGCSTLNEWA